MKCNHENCINKEKLIESLYLSIEMDKKRLNLNKKLKDNKVFKPNFYNKDWIGGSIEQTEIIINAIKNGEFDNENN